MNGVVLDPITGKPEVPAEDILQKNLDNGWWIKGLSGKAPDLRERLPANILALLEKAGSYRAAKFAPQGSLQTWEETIYAVQADGTQIAASTVEAIMVPDYTLPQLFLGPGRTMCYTVFFDYSTVITTPGTLTLALRYAGVGGTALATSGAFAPDPTAASTTVSGMVSFWLTHRGVWSTSSACMCMGYMLLSDFDDASATTIVGNLNMIMIPTSAPATVNINTLTANALSPTAKFSVNTAGTQLTAHLAVLEALN